MKVVRKERGGKEEKNSKSQMSKFKVLEKNKNNMKSWGTFHPKVIKPLLLSPKGKSVKEIIKKNLKRIIITIFKQL